MRRLFNVIFQLIVAGLVIFLLTAVWIVFDGLNDLGEKSDVALVTGRSEAREGAAEQPRLDRAIKLYNAGEFPFIIVSGATSRSTYDEPAAMAKYLESHGIPSNAIIENHRAESTQDTARHVAEIMKSHEFESIMVVSDYYDITGTKLALTHEGVAEIQKAHVGKLQKEDAWKIGREVVSLYNYIGRVFLLPAAEKVKEEAKVGADKAKADAEQAKKKVDKSLDSMAK
jgi:vancomycin permeability regulator SanA